MSYVLTSGLRNSVAPPASRNPTTLIIPAPDANNVCTQPTGPEYQFSVGEGVYTLRDDLLLGYIPPHPADNPAANVNVLDTKPVPTTAGSKLSSVTLTPRRLPSFAHAFHPGNSTRSIIPPSILEQASETSHSESDSGSYSFYRVGTSHPARAFGDDNPALRPIYSAKDAKDPLKRRKPKSGIVKSNSTLVSRVVVHEHINKRLQDHRSDGLFAFVNLTRAFLWLDLSSPTKAEALTKVLFTRTHPLCHDFNPVTKTSSHLDLVLGFSSADLIWYEPMSQKYTRVNKNGVINSTAVTHVRWLPNSENLFLAAHLDGSLVVYDKEKEDAPLAPDTPLEPTARRSTDSSRAPRMFVRKSVRSKNQKTNPVSYWRVSNDRINCFEFSPNQRHLAVVCEDGSMRVIDIHQERLLDLFSSYYGGMTCVCWSPDGRYLVTGSQDDLVSIWSVADGSLVARCEGHRSWITAVAFDPWRCDERTYRIGSVAEDCRLLLWDFNVNMLARPRAASIRQRGSITSYPPSMHERTQSQTTLKRLQTDSAGSDIPADFNATRHPIPPRLHTATLPPVLSKVVDDHPLSWVGFEEDCIITMCFNGHIRTWERPKE